MPPLLVVTGPPGAGKSTVARLVTDRFEPSALVEGDAFFAFLARGAIEPWLPESADQNGIVIQAAAAAAGRYAAGGITTVYDGVVGPWFLPTFAAASGLEALDYVVLLPSEDRCVQQVAGRTGHAFTDEGATRTMHRKFTQGAVDARHVVVPAHRPEDVADQIVATMADGSLRHEVRAP